jgi:hypothetical protein
MPPLSEALVTGAFMAAIGLIGGFALAVFWSPFMLSARVRALFDQGLTGNVGLNYAFSFAVLSALHAFTLTTLLVLYASPQTTLNFAFYTGLGFPLLGWLIASFALPEYGYDWIPEESPVLTRTLLGLGVLWYAVLTIAPVFVLAVFYYMPM